MLDINKIFDFASKLEALKKLERFRGQFGWKDYPTPIEYDSVADHSWRLAMLVIMIAPKLSKPINLEKALKMALVHDIPELLAGDGDPLGEDGTGKHTYAYDEKAENEKHAREKAAAKKIFNELDEPLGEELYELCIEYMEMSGFEAEVVRSLDKIEGTMQAFEYRNAHMYQEHFEFSTKYCMKYADVDPSIRELGEALVKKMQTAFKPFVK